MEQNNLIVKPWTDYELIDSGDNRKLERYGAFLVIRPETQAIWKPKHPAAWEGAHAEFRWADGKGAWQKKNMPENCELAWQDVRFTMRLTSFKHTGIFPEQAANWEWIGAQVAQLAKPRVLNLFGYTGIASIVAAKHGAQVTHVDASKQSNTWAKENAALSDVPPESIRYLLDDALKFVEREARRGASYEGIILDPPAFGRGPKGEVWKIEEQIAPLLEALKTIFSAKTPGAFFLLNGYAAGYSPQSFLQAVESVFGEIKTKGSFGELHIEEARERRYVPSGIYVRFAQ
jgi:23S rRNA (cytosine1962-C5)-methyltransferase